MAINFNVGTQYYLDKYVGEFISKYNDSFDNDIGEEVGSYEYDFKLSDMQYLSRYFDMLGAISQLRGPTLTAHHQMLIDSESNISLTVVIMYNMYSQRLKFIPHSYSRLGSDQVFYSSKSLELLYSDYQKESTVYMVESLG